MVSQYFASLVTEQEVLDKKRLVSVGFAPSSLVNCAQVLLTRERKLSCIFFHATLFLYNKQHFAE